MVFPATGQGRAARNNRLCGRKPWLQHPQRGATCIAAWSPPGCGTSQRHQRVIYQRLTDNALSALCQGWHRHSLIWEISGDCISVILNQFMTCI